MEISLVKLLSQEGKTESHHVPLEISEVEIGGETYPILESQPVDAEIPETDETHPDDVFPDHVCQRVHPVAYNLRDIEQYSLKRGGSGVDDCGFSIPDDRLCLPEQDADETVVRP